jgi:aryl-alcohol dehydrogenase-like predicted oxidoreductase
LRATRGYLQSPLAIAFVKSTIIGATTLVQLPENIDSVNVVLETEVLAELDAIHPRYPLPAP